ncbi:hypothetical protein CROQUDRAFT_651717 [Cronartium quercuum f. sp. fusiforme G11]|uniref:MARVEL domain-containing protein n=1 Tax=Cronartium quercuum f. sp. fusiforme G11 TaxID=708437 RepID=A0A9P6NWN8_9BASI|nr:hypothetical protein CROQUDRAFT_651717 [Cronartium quercuum f. sp. fusiforme G11]
MATMLDKMRNADFTGLNRAFGRGKHSPKIPPFADESRGIAGGPQASGNPGRSGKGFGKISGGRGSILDDDDISPIQVAIRSATMFFILINLFIYMAIASFQKKWKVGPSGLTGLALFVLCEAFLHALAFLVVPQIYERTDVLKGFARAIRLTRIQFIVYGTQTGLALILSLVATISAYTGGCKDPKSDPNAELADYVSHMGGFCRNKRAAAAFWWFTFLSFGLSLAFVLKSWYTVRKLGPSHPSFEPPRNRTVDEEADDEDFASQVDDLHHNPLRNEMSAVVRPSNVGGYYGERPVFDADQLPAGYARSTPYGEQPVPAANELVYQRPAPPAMTAYKDPFDEIRAQIYSSGS